MDRIRAGLTGLGAVFLVTAAASLLFAPDEAQTVAAAQQEPGEPLAQLGVAPGSEKMAEAQREEKAATAVPEPAPAQAQPSGGTALGADVADPAYPSPTGAGRPLNPDLPVAI